MEQMRGFLLKTSIALALAAALHLVAGSFADGRLDDYYLRFTGERRSAMILGTSRAAQALRPGVMSPLLSSADAHGGLFNYAFTIAHSPFGPTYVNAVKGKLDPRSSNGLFLITVDPWSLSNPVDPKGRGGPLREEERTLGQQWTFTGTPNYEYLLRHVPAGWGSLIAGPLHDPDTMTLLHPDGWLEIRAQLDNDTVLERTLRRVDHYREQVLPRNEPSDVRLDALGAMIDLLHPHGAVYLIRLPVCDDIVGLEDQLWPGFNDRMQEIAGAHGVPYWDLLPENDRYTYTDGNHLDTLSARTFSTDLALRIAATLPAPR